MDELNASEKPLIIGFVSDLMFAPRIESAAEQQGFRVEWIENAAQVAATGSLYEEPPQRQFAEHLYGPLAGALEEITLKQPALMIFDLNNAGIPWREWIPVLTAVPATRRIPILCFGSHVDVDAIETARKAGAKAVLARSRFVNALPELINKHARRIDQQALEEACTERLPDLARRGLEQFNHGEYFEAHETLEEAWNADLTPGRELYRAILQLAVAYLQIERGNYNGAAKMFLRLRQWIDPLPDRCRGVDVGALKTAARQAHEALLALGPDGIEAFNREVFVKVSYEG